jgi:hypothetical protein
MQWFKDIDPNALDRYDYPMACYDEDNERLISPGEGWRLLKIGELIIQGDEMPDWSGWRQIACWLNHDMVGIYHKAIRRKI